MLIFQIVKFNFCLILQIVKFWKFVNFLNFNNFEQVTFFQISQ